jgi:hypothetical protein
VKGSRAILVVAFGFLLVGLMILRGFANDSVDNPVASVNNEAPRGLMGLGLWLESRGVKVEQDPLLPNPPVDRLQGATVVVVPPEVELWSERESEVLGDAIKEGDIDLIVLCDEDRKRQARLAKLLEVFGTACKTPGELELKPRVLQPAMPRWPERVLVRSGGTVELPDERLAFPSLIDDEDRAVMIRVPHGHGRVTILGSASALTNDTLGREHNAALASQLFVRDRVVFLEGHHKLRQSKVIDEAFAGMGPRIALGAFILAALFVLIGFAPRKGDAPLPRSTAADSAAEAASRGLATLFVENGLGEAEARGLDPAKRSERPSPP